MSETICAEPRTHAANDNLSASGADFYRAVGRRLCELRAALGKSQREMAEACGITRRTWDAWERGRKIRYVFGLVMLARRFGLSLDWLFCGDERGMAPALLRGISAARRGMCLVTASSRASR